MIEPVTYAVVPAAGSGHRFGGPVKKQFLQLHNKEILIHTLEVLESVPQIQGIYVVTSRDDIPLCQDLVSGYPFKKICAMIPGGNTRQESVYQGLLHLPSDCEIAVIHDGARPMITAELIQKSIREAALWGGAVVAVPVKDTIKEVDESGNIRHTPNRSTLWSASTPQTFRTSIIVEAYKEAFRQGDTSLTDDSQAVEKYSNTSVRLVPGSYENIKITTPEDLALAETILKKRRLF